MTEKIGRIEKSPVVVGPRKPGQAQPANGWFGTAPKKKAFDSAKRARLHRALDAVMDSRRAKDAGQGVKEDVICTHCGRPIRPSLVNPGKYTHLSAADTKACGHPAKP